MIAGVKKVRKASKAVQEARTSPACIKAKGGHCRY